jgi:DNA-binding HxlR family transcriptional regulator
MTRRNYGQFCGLAHALDVVGERWTLLIVRELASGPRRYTELAESLTGIGTSILATRIRQLEADGVVQRRLVLDQPSSTVVYELTDAGRELAKAAIPLAMWGARHQMDGATADDETFRAEWSLNFLASGKEGVPADLDADYEFHVGDSAACLHVHDGRMSVTPGISTTPIDATVRATAQTLVAIAGGRLSLADAVHQGDLDVDGDPDSVAALLAIVDKRLQVLGRF